MVVSWVVAKTMWGLDVWPGVAIGPGRSLRSRRISGRATAPPEERERCAVRHSARIRSVAMGAVAAGAAALLGLALGTSGTAAGSAGSAAAPSGGPAAASAQAKMFT